MRLVKPAARYHLVHMSPSGTVRALPALSLAVLLSLPPCAAAVELPKPHGKVNDFAGLLVLEDREALEAQLASLERDTSAEMAVVTIPSLEGRVLEEYATALFTEWGVGKKGKDNGVLVLVAVADRAIRIEVGYGLEGVLPDGLAGSVIREVFLPRFREDDYRSGILAGTARLAEIVRRNETLSAEQRAALDGAGGDAGPMWLLMLVPAGIAGVGAFFGAASLRARVVSEIFGGLVLVAFGIGISVLMHPDVSPPVVAGLAIACGVIGFIAGGRPRIRKMLRGTGKRSGGSRWIGSPSGSSSSRGSGSSSGSFGGGRSGGGGASGRW